MPAPSPSPNSEEINTYAGDEPPILSTLQFLPNVERLKISECDPYKDRTDDEPQPELPALQASSTIRAGYGYPAATSILPCIPVSRPRRPDQLSAIQEFRIRL